MKKSDSYNCPKCDKELLSKNNIIKSGLVIKSKLVFLNPNGDVMCRCKRCKSVVALPILFNQFKSNEST